MVAEQPFGVRIQSTRRDAEWSGWPSVSISAFNRASLWLAIDNGDDDVFLNESATGCE